MTRSIEEGSTAVLDRRAECEVVLLALSDPDFVHPAGDGTEAATDFDERFSRQTMHDDTDPSLDGFMQETFKPRPMFVLSPGDGICVLRAAERIVNQKALLDRFTNRVTGLTKAARTMIVCLESRND